MLFRSVTPAGRDAWIEAHVGEILFAETAEHYWTVFCTEDGDWYASRPPENDEHGNTVNQSGLAELVDLPLPLTLFIPGPSARLAIDAPHLERQRAFSLRTFGPGARPAGVLDHIRKELAEIEAAPADLGEWVDVAILAFDGALRAGHAPQAIIAAVVAKQARNEARTWPDWRTADPDKAIEHDRTGEPQKDPR